MIRLPAFASAILAALRPQKPFAQREAERRAAHAAAKAAAKKAAAAADLAARTLAANDCERQLNYYEFYDDQRYTAAGRPPVSWDANGVCSWTLTPWPTDAQWAAMTPEQKANPGSVLPGDLPGV